MIWTPEYNIHIKQQFSQCAQQLAADSLYIGLLNILIFKAICIQHVSRHIFKVTIIVNRKL